MISAKKKKRILLIETTLRTLPLTKVSLKSSGLSISEKIPKLIDEIVILAFQCKFNFLSIYT